MIPTTPPRSRFADSLFFASLLAAFAFVPFSLGTSTAAEPPITAVAFTPDGEFAIACSQSGLQVL
ncbi:MAG: hypothetical protein N2C14_30720, partial [Planctomycetales bacterium]